MVRSGLVNIFNLPIIDHREGINAKNDRRNLMKMFDVNNHATMRKNLTDNIPKLNTPGKEILHKRSVVSSMIDIPLTYWRKKLDDEAMEVVRNTSKTFITENLQYKVIESYISRTETFMDTITSRATSTEEVIPPRVK